MERGGWLSEGPGGVVKERENMRSKWVEDIERPWVSFDVVVVVRKGKEVRWVGRGRMGVVNGVVELGCGGGWIRGRGGRGGVGGLVIVWGEM